MPHHALPLALRRAVLALPLLTLYAASAPTLAAFHWFAHFAPPVNAQPEPTPLTLRSPDGRLQFLVDSPGAQSSPASRSNIELTPNPAKPTPPTLGYRVTSRIVVQTSHPDALAALCAPSQAVITSADPTGANLRQFYIVSTASIRAAAALADILAADPRMRSVEIEMERPRTDRLPNDPDLSLQWYLNNTLTSGGDLNVIPAWNAGITGAGVTIGLIEGGFDITQPDLAPAFSADASNTSAFYTFTFHGTATAGIAAMRGNNDLFGAGVAHQATLARLYYGTDPETAASYLYRNDLTSVKNNSWGPWDNANISNISAIEDQALAEAAATGRAGKGEVIVWAAGNGGEIGDRVDYDPYASNRSVIAIGAIGSTDLKSTYSELGSSLMLVAPSASDFSLTNNSGVYSTYPNSSSTTGFGGTSATSPMAAGVVALILQANPNLTWRDVAHVLIRSARKNDPTNAGWTLNAAGLWQNYAYGYGCINASAAVTLAQSWVNRPPAFDYNPPALASLNLPIPDNGPAIASTIPVPANMLLERVQLILSAPHPRLGDLRVELVSPTGTHSLFAETRQDFSAGYTAYTFTSVRHWGETARGVWTLNLTDGAVGQTGTLSGWQLRLIGTTRPCPCDWNTLGGTTVQDVFDFLADWFGGLGDFNNDGAVSIQDIFDFLGCWFSPPGACTP